MVDKFNNSGDDVNQINDEEPEFEELDTSYLETIKDLDEMILYPEFEAYWMLLFPELNLYRFVHHDEEIEDIYEADEEELYRPILLIHGFHSSHLTWNWMVQQLWIDGYRNIFAMKMHSYMIGLDVLSEQLDDVINKILMMLTSYEFIHIIGHSMGGMIARYYLKKVGRADPKIRLLVTLGSPLRGLFRWFKSFEGILVKMTQSFVSSKLEVVTDFAPVKGKMKLITDITSDELYNVTMVNITGSLKKLGGGDGLFKGKPIFDMINLQVPASHIAINKPDASYQIIQDLLFNQASVFKIWLLEIDINLEPNIDFNNKESLITEIPYTDKRKYYVEFKRKNELSQRYPSTGYMNIKNEKLIPKEPFIIYVGSSLHRRREIVSMEIYQKGRLKSTKVSEHKIIVKLGQTKEYFETKTIESGEHHPKIALAISSYKIKHFL
ncbi:MAG: alpha/beta fold hydrolase [Candidatus Hodarchaeales archaeon]